MTPASPTTATGPEAERRRVTVRGVVQGVGFRPFVHTLATSLELTGHVANTGDGVVAEVEGAPSAVARFCERLVSDAPPLALVERVDQVAIAPTGGAGFAIGPSPRTAPARTLVPPDTATCADCLAELADPGDRRHRHPFITCTNCGPRYTIVTGLPYDRQHTTMARFPMCADCAREYADPGDRRFHAQPVACPACGPRLVLLTGPGAASATGEAAVAAARRLLASGGLLAVKGLGGYHLACDAANAAAVAELRRRKERGGKPFALMARTPEDVAHLVHLGPEERRALTGAARPIVLLRRRGAAAVRARGDAPEPAGGVAPGSPDLGVMLPYTPVHHLLLGLPGDPPGPRLLVMTSGNLAGEPIVTRDREALDRLGGLADAWLTHDRPIQVPCDDSVVRVVDGQETVLRRSRGHAPLPVQLPAPVPPSLAVGGDLKNTFCLGAGERAWLSAHVGDMDDLGTQRVFERAEATLEDLTGVRPTALAADLHPAYRSARWSVRNAAGRPVTRVQHHHAHVASAMAEHRLPPGSRVIGVAFDGTGYGTDGAVWGGEFLIAGYGGFTRHAHLGYVPLPGGDMAVRRPYRMALAHLRAAGIPWDADLPPVAACPPGELKLLARQLERGVACVPTSSMGRLFDAVSALAGVCQSAGYEAQAAIELEAAACDGGLPEPGADADAYAFALRPAHREGGALTADPGPVLGGVVRDLRAGAPVRLIAARFHAAVAELVRDACRAARERYRLRTVALSGGVFANAVLSSACAQRLAQDGFTVLRHRRIPPNDGGLALGQLAVAALGPTGGG
ncbi:carbamoyltransferase HypF [Streptomyces sp. C10-9-1]|uniref:carbamoyltransferase HypF n=1 Tax=Streptomyces sp. C10-9-1 TaxID=1859285 RepID=UPI003D7166D2